MFSLLAAFTLIYIPLTVASVGRRIWIKVSGRAGGLDAGTS